MVEKENELGSCPDCGCPATHPSGLCLDCHQAKLEIDDVQKMEVKIDLSKDGLAMMYKPYEILGWNVLWNTPEPIGSGNVWKKVNESLGPGKTISRASVIFFLNRQVGLGFMGWKDATGKGGHQRRYYPRVSMLTLAQIVMDEVARALGVLIDQAHAVAGGTSLVFDGDQIE